MSFNVAIAALIELNNELVALEAATKATNSFINIAIWLFSAGILFSVLHATLDYYMTESWFNGYQKDVEKLFDNKIDWEVFVDRNESRVSHHWIMHLLGWLSGVTFFIGLVIGVCQLK